MSDDIESPAQLSFFSISITFLEEHTVTKNFYGILPTLLIATSLLSTDRVVAFTPIQHRITDAQASSFLNNQTNKTINVGPSSTSNQQEFKKTSLLISAREAVKSPQIVSTSVDYNSESLQSATHSFYLQVGDNSLAQLLIDCPPDIIMNHEIKISDSTGKRVETKISVDARRATLTFVQPITPKQIIKVALQGKTTLLSPIQRNSHIWFYSVYGRSVGMKSNILIGLAQIRAY
jgi:hypothetical protein